MIREAIGILAAVVSLISVLAGFAEAHPMLCLLIVGVSAWGLS